MPIPQIHIHQRFARIGIEYQPSRMKIKTPSAQIQMNSPAAKLEIRSLPGHLSINQTQAFIDEGLKPLLVEERSQAKQAAQAVRQEIAQTAAWGQRFIDPKSHASISAWLSRYQTPRQFSMVLMPGPFSVQVRYTMGKLASRVQVQQPHINVQVSPVHISYHKAVVKPYIAQQNYLRISVSRSGGAFQGLA